MDQLVREGDVLGDTASRSEWGQGSAPAAGPASLAAGSPQRQHRLVERWRRCSRLVPQAFAASALAVSGILLACAMTLLAFLLASSLEPQRSLTMWEARSSPKTLQIMLGVVVFVPLILLYTGWVYRVLAGPITVEQIRRDSKRLY